MNKLNPFYEHRNKQHSHSVNSQKNNRKIEGTFGWDRHCRGGKRGENDPWVCESGPIRAPNLETLGGSTRNRGW